MIVYFTTILSTNAFYVDNSTEISGITCFTRRDECNRAHVKLVTCNIGNQSVITPSLGINQFCFFYCFDDYETDF